MKTKIPLFYPYIPKKKILKEISNTLFGRYLGQGPKVDKFEKKFGEQLNYKYPLFVNSGTSALELAYHLIGLKQGDEVIVPVFNCTAGLMGLKRRGVTTVFADVTGNMTIDWHDVQRKITKRTKAIVAVNMGGIEVDKKPSEISIPVITDSAQHLAHTSGDYIVYSFQAIKQITTCDGGMLVLKDKDTYERAKKLRWFGIDRNIKPKKPWLVREMTSEPEEAGYKYQPTDIDACFGLAALPDLPKIMAHRKKLAETYKKLLTGQINVIAGTWLLTILTMKRDELAAYLAKNGVETNIAHIRNDKYKIFGGKWDLPMMDFLEDKYLCLPLNPKVTVKDVEYICKLINRFYEPK